MAMVDVDDRCTEAACLKLIFTKFTYGMKRYRYDVRARTATIKHRSSQEADSHLKSVWLHLRIGDRLALSLHSSNELGDLSQWPCRDDSIMNVDTDIIIAFQNV